MQRTPGRRWEIGGEGGLETGGHLLVAVGIRFQDGLRPLQTAGVAIARQVVEALRSAEPTHTGLSPPIASSRADDFCQQARPGGVAHLVGHHAQCTAAGGTSASTLVTKLSRRRL